MSNCGYAATDNKLYREEKILIEVKNLTKRYGNVRAVNDISFTVDNFGVYGFLGPNGAGKSTTMNIITGGLAASSGEVTINGHDIFEEPIEAKKCIGYLPENPPLYNDMTPEEYLVFVARAKGISSSNIEKEVTSAMKKTGLIHMADRLIRNLSKGYKQRVGIAQAIIGDPDIIILDEPTVGLDPLQIIEIRELIRDLGRDHTVILSSHVLPEISAVCDYVIVIAHGKIVAQDTMANINRTFDETQILRLETKGNGGQLKNALEKIEGVKNVNINTYPSYVQAVIEVLGDADIRETVSDTLRDMNMPVLGFTSNAQSLEDIFRKLVNEQHYGEPDPAMPVKKVKKSEKQETVPSEKKGRAYYDYAEDTAKEEEYTPLFEDDDSDDSDENA